MLGKVAAPRAAANRVQAGQARWLARIRSRKASADTTDEATPEEPFKVPAGYQPKKRGKKMVYCKKAMESGTRFSQEKCYSEDQLRALEAEREQEQVTLDQNRKVCGTVESCGAN